MPIFKRFVKSKGPKRELEVTPRAAYTYDCGSSDTGSAAGATIAAAAAAASGVTPGELVFPALQPYVDRGSLLASVLNESLATALDKLGSYNYSANLAAHPKLLMLFADKNPDRCMFATPHVVATIHPSTGVTWGWAQAHSARDAVPHALRSMGRRDGIAELSEPELAFPPGWLPKGKKARNDALAVLAHQLGAAAVGVRLGHRRGGGSSGHGRSGSGSTRRSSSTTTSTYGTYSSFSASFSEDIPVTPRTPAISTSPGGTPVSPPMPATPPPSGFAGIPAMSVGSSSGLFPLAFDSDPPVLAPYFIAPRQGNYAVFLLDFGPSLLRTRKSIAEVGPAIRRLLSNGPPVRDHREAFRGLAYGMGWALEETTASGARFGSSCELLKDDDSMSFVSASTGAGDPALVTTMHIYDDASSIDVSFNGAGRLTGIKMQLAG